MAAVTRILSLFLALLFAALTVDARAAGVELAEQKIKAGLLYNFLKYTQWPAAEANGAAIVCLFGGDPFDGHLKPMGGRTVNQRVIEVREVAGTDELDGCALVFVRSEKKASWPQLLKALSGKDVLTVGDWDGFTAAGGMIEFTRVEERVGVLINVDAVSATRLTVQDRLLKLASAVRAPTR
jgi:hypothetical protein